MPSLDMQTKQTPQRVLALYDLPMWKGLDEERVLRLQKCRACGTFRYPPGPVCPECLSPEADWTQISGAGEILSWVIFHRQYLPEYPAPYNVIAVRLAEGPTMISNLIGPEPEGSWIGRKVRLVLQPMDDGVILPRFEIAD